MRLLPALFLALLTACTGGGDDPAAAIPAGESVLAAPERVSEPMDDGSFLQRIDPIGGQWQVERIGETDFTRFKGWVNFSAGGFINHGAGCGGGYPAFYKLDGANIGVTRIEPIRTGKCAPNREMADAPQATRTAAAESERRLAAFIDQVASWNREVNVLTLVGRDGTRARLTRPAEPHPDIAGRWLIETIGGERLVTERRPPTLAIQMNNIGAFADCNSFGSEFTTPAPGRISVTGPIMSTAIGCAPEDQAEDDLMARAIRSATAYRLEGDRLVFTGGPGMVVRRPPPPNRRLAGEYESCGNTLLGAYHAGPITLSIDGRTMRDNASCTATYVTDGPNLQVQLAFSDQCDDAAPPFVPGEPIEVGGDISMLAATRPDGYGFNEQGQLILRTNRGLLTMCRKGDPPPFGS